MKRFRCGLVVGKFSPLHRGHELLIRRALAACEHVVVLSCAPDFDFVQDGTRRDAAFRQRQHAWYCEQLSRTDVPFLLAEGSIEARIHSVAVHLPRSPAPRNTPC